MALTIAFSSYFTCLSFVNIIKCLIFVVVLHLFSQTLYFVVSVAKE